MRVYGITIVISIKSSLLCGYAFSSGWFYLQAGNDVMVSGADGKCLVSYNYIYYGLAIRPSLEVFHIGYFEVKMSSSLFSILMLMKHFSEATKQISVNNLFGLLAFILVDLLSLLSVQNITTLI